MSRIVGNGAETVKSVTRVLDLFEHLARARGGVSVSDLGRSAGLHVSTVHRLLKTLVARGYAEQHPVTRAYTLGAKVFELGHTYLGSLDLQGIARPYVETLRDKLDETVHFAVYSRGEVIRVATALGTQPVSVRLAPRMPAHCTALGKVLLAHLPPAELRAFFARARLQRFTPKTITRRRRFLEEIQRVRRRGYAIDDEEMAEDLCCLGAPVRGEGERLFGALGVAVPKARFRPVQIRDWLEQLRDTGSRMASRLALAE
ncbi:MAG: IclR family transcriptional regulator [Candidatus Rokuibacteriota bacterium]